MAAVPVEEALAAAAEEAGVLGAVVAAATSVAAVPVEEALAAAVGAGLAQASLETRELDTKAHVSSQVRW